jgi:hypothetical protein
MGVKAIFQEARLEYVLPTLNKAGEGNLSAIFVFDGAEDANKKSACFSALKDAGIRVVVLVQSGSMEEIRLSDGIEAYCLPLPQDLPALFDLAYYTCNTGLFLFSFGFPWRVDSILAAAQALTSDSGLAYAVLEKAEAGFNHIVPGFPEGSLSGVYRKSAVAIIGSLDGLFTDENYLCEDYRIRSEAHGFRTGAIGCECETMSYKQYTKGLKRDEEALLRKYGKKLKPRLDKSLIHEFSNHICGRRQTIKSAALYHDGDDRMARILSEYISHLGLNEAVTLNMMNVCDIRADAKADLIVFCLPIFRYPGFDILLSTILHDGNAQKVAFFDINYLSGDNLEKVLADRGFEGGGNALTIYFRKGLRDLIVESGYDIFFSRVTRNVPENVENALHMMFPETWEMMLRNLATRYYTYVCDRIECKNKPESDI